MKRFLSILFLLFSFYAQAQKVELTRDVSSPGSNASRTALAAVNGVVYGNDGESFVLEARKFGSYQELRAFENPTQGVFYQAWLSDRLEFWKPDFSDKTTPDNNLTTLVSLDGVRYKRFFSSLSNPQASTFLGVWNPVTNSPTLTSMPAASGTYYLVTTPGTRSGIAVNDSTFTLGDQLISNGSGWYRIRSNLADGSVSEGKIAAGAVSSAKLQNRAVTPEKTNFFVPSSKNLFNRADTANRDGYFLEPSHTSQGVFNYPVASTLYGYSHFIKVTPGLSYTGWDTGNGMRKTAYYDINKQPVSGGNTNASVTFTVPAGVEYVRVTFWLDRKATFQFEQSGAATQYEAYAGGSKIPASTIKTDSDLQFISSSQKASIAGKLDRTAILSKFFGGSKNLFDKARALKVDTLVINSNGQFGNLAGWQTAGPFQVDASTTYTLQGIPASSKAVRFESVTGATLGFHNIAASGFTFTTPAGTDRIYFTIKRPDETLNLDAVQLEKGSVATNVVPYVAPIRTVTEIQGARVVASTADLSTDDAHQFVSSTEKASWNSKLNPSAVQSQTLEPSRNLLNPALIIQNKFVVRVNGDIDSTASATGWKIVGPIPVTAGTSYVVSGIPSLTSKGVRFENASKAKVGYWDISTNGAVFVAPAGATQMYVTLQRADETLNLATAQIEVGTVASGFVAFDPGRPILTAVNNIPLPIRTINSKVGDANGNLTLLKSDVSGIDKIDNTRDLDKPVSTAQAAVNATKLDKASVKTSILGASKNLFNAADTSSRDGYFLEPGSNAQGVFYQPIANATYGYSHFIKVTPGLVYAGGDGVNGMRKTAYYNASKQPVTGGNSNTSTTFTVPAGVEYVKVTYWVARKANFQFLQGSSVPATYEPFSAGVKAVTGIDDAIIQASGPAVATMTHTLTLSNASKILFTGCSYEESSYTMTGKSWIAKLSNYSDWQLANTGVGGQRMIDIAQRLRTDVATYGVRPSTYRPTYVVLGNNGNEYFPNAGENLDLYQEQFRVAAEAAKAWGAKPIFSTNYHVNNNRLLESSLKAFADQNKYPYAGVGLNGEKMMQMGAYAGFWSGSHPGVRTNSYIWQEWLYYLNQLPRPAKTIKLFRPRKATQTVDSLNYNSIAARYERWKEINVGERVLLETDSSEHYYDRLNEGLIIDPNDENNTQPSYKFQSNTNEYAQLIAGSAVSFSSYALAELIVDRVNFESFKITVKGDAGLSFYLKNNNDPSKYETADRDKALVFQVSKAVYDAFTDAVGTKFTSSGVNASKVQFAYTGKLKSYAMGRGWFLCFLADSDLDQSTTNRNPSTTSITRVSDSGTVATLNLKAPYRYSYSYFAGMNRPKGGWQLLSSEVSYASGVYTITLPADSRKYFEFDKLRLLVAKSGTFAISDLSAEYTGGQAKPEYTKEIEQKSYGTEIQTVRGFDANWSTSGGWTSGGNSLVSMPVGVRDYPPFLSSTSHVELGFDSDGFPQKISKQLTLPVGGTARRGWQKVTVRVVARLFPQVYNPAKTGPYFTNAPVITKSSYDLATLCLGLRTPGLGYPSMITRQMVDVGWSEITFETTLPVMENAVILDLWRDSELSNQNPSWPMQIYDVSVQVSP